MLNYEKHSVPKGAHMKKILLVLIMSAWSVIAFPADNSGLIVPCTTCHKDVRENTVVPVLSNYTPKRIRTLLINYRENKETVTIMQRVMKAYNDDEINTISLLMGKKQEVK